MKSNSSSKPAHGSGENNKQPEETKNMMTREIMPTEDSLPLCQLGTSYDCSDCLAFEPERKRTGPFADMLNGHHVGRCKHGPMVRNGQKESKPKSRKRQARLMPKKLRPTFVDKKPKLTKAEYKQAIVAVADYELRRRMACDGAITTLVSEEVDREANSSIDRILKLISMSDGVITIERGLLEMFLRGGVEMGKIAQEYMKETAVREEGTPE